MGVDKVMFAVVKEIRRIMLETNVDQSEFEALVKILGYNNIDEFIKETRLL